MSRQGGKAARRQGGARARGRRAACLPMEKGTETRDEVRKERCRDHIYIREIQLVAISELGECGAASVDIAPGREPAREWSGV